MFGLLVQIARRMQKGNTGLMPDEVKRLMAASAHDMADVVVRLSQLECVEVEDDCGEDRDEILLRLAESGYENERIYYAVKAIVLGNPILNTEEWRRFLAVLRA